MTIENIARIHAKLLKREHESLTASALRETLLPKLISGELCVMEIAKLCEVTA